ncbi:MAG TPA: HEAT repeat domain-containing protein, partial [Pyrinomonadaceae bacterium]|nr:HEAT repeat domain-containing protein [Pyrinomonadaceae bacterium]
MRTQFPLLRLRAAITCTAAGLLIMADSLSANAAIQAESDDWTSSIFSTYGITIILVLVLAGLFVYKKIQKQKETQEFSEDTRSRRQENEPVFPQQTNATMSVSERTRQPLETVHASEKSAEQVPAFGAYRIDQEVGKLVLGKPHRSDVMSSRAAEDRRAIETSLIKALDSNEVSGDVYHRVQQALEEYGFVARQSATLLLGRDAWERSSAARTLGQMKSPASLPFLIEALHDGDSVVRNQAIASLALLKMPAAIGALLDIARRHSDIPATLLSDTLSACSVETLSFLDAPAMEA